MEDFWKKEGSRATQDQLGGQQPQATISTQRGLPDYFYALNCDVDAILRGARNLLHVHVHAHAGLRWREVWTNSYEQERVVP